MKRILIIDDDDDVQILLTTFIKQYTPYKTIVAEDGEVAIDVIKVSPPDLILLDMMLPRIGGTALFHDLKKNEQTKNIPIIFMSGVMKNEVLQKEGLDMGADAYFSKPLDLKMLLEKIESLLE